VDSKILRSSKHEHRHEARLMGDSELVSLKLRWINLEYFNSLMSIVDSQLSLEIPKTGVYVYYYNETVSRSASSRSRLSTRERSFEMAQVLLVRRTFVCAAFLALCGDAALTRLPMLTSDTPMICTATCLPVLRRACFYFNFIYRKISRNKILILVGACYNDAFAANIMFTLVAYVASA